MSNSIKIQGKFISAGKISEVGDKKTKVRNFWLDITDNPDFPNTPEFNLINEKCLLIDNLKANEIIQVTFNIQGRKYIDKQEKTRIMTNLQAYKIDKVVVKSAVPMPVASVNSGDDTSDDLPF